METNKKFKKIILTGGGTGGSVTPLLAVAEELLSGRSAFKWQLIFVGTHRGPEREMVAEFNQEIGSMPFFPLVGGKLRRYFSVHNFFDFFKILVSGFISWRLLSTEKPDIVVSAGSFVSVPLVWAAAWKRIPVLIHQQDVRPGLANRLMAPFARLVTVTFKKSVNDFKNAAWIGNPVRDWMISNEELTSVKEKFRVSGAHPLILVVGGGTGAAELNRLVYDAVPSLSGVCQIIHVVGKGKLPDKISNQADYQVHEFIANRHILALMQVSDLVVSRCGLAFLTELSFLSKAAILVPMPASHQEDNAAIFQEAGAAVVLREQKTSADELATEIRRLIGDQERRTEMSRKMGAVIERGAAVKMREAIEDIILSI